MSPLLRFLCSRPVAGFRAVQFDERKLIGWPMLKDDEDDISFLAPPSATDDERSLIEKWGPVMEPSEIHEVTTYLLPNSSETEQVDLFDTAPALFMDLADSRPSTEVVLSFANKFGSLSEYPDRVDDWCAIISAMKRAVVLWTEAKAEGDFRKLIRLLNRQHSAHRSRRGTPMYLFLEEQSEGGPAKLAVRLGSLKDAIWAQFMLAVDGRRNLAACTHCGSWYFVDDGRVDKRYCSDACKMRAYRERKKKA